MKRSSGTRPVLVWFWLYIAGMLWLLFGQRAGKPAAPMADRISLIPFATIRQYLTDWGQGLHVRAAVINLGGNIGMFVPFGLGLPWLYPQMRQFRPFFLFVLTVDGMIEFMQWITGLGFCDVDDIILNLLGICLGWLLYHGYYRRNETKR